MRKIRLSDTDIELFDMEVSPTEFLFFTKHKDAFRCMWKEQGKPFWTRFIVSFRSYTVKHGVIKQMSFDSPKLNDLLDQGFINIHEQFLDGTPSMARAFVDDIARLAQNHDKFPNLDSKNFGDSAKDPFYCRETRELFRQFFGNPDQKSSYLKVYILSPVYLRFGGSVCRCLRKWMDAPQNECGDDSYWIPPEIDSETDKKESNVIMCSNCLDECGTLFFQEKLCGKPDGPKFIESWKKGDPRFNDKKNPLFNRSADSDSDWRTDLSVEDFRDFVYYSNNKYGEKCSDCLSLSNHCPSNSGQENENPADKTEKKKRKKKKKKNKGNEAESVNDEEEIEKLVNHIEGTAPLDVMPENTIAGAKERSPTKETSPPANEITQDTKAQVKKEIFGKKAKISDDFKYGIMPYQDKSGADLKRSVIGGFKVKKIEDERTKACEITVTITTIKGENATDKTPVLPGYERNFDPRKINRFPLTAELLKTKIKGLPKRMEWYEGWNWCASVLNFYDEEKYESSKPTNFTIKVNGKEEESVKRTMFKLLFYVIQRKSRYCPGWNMEDDDVVACILPDESTEFEGTTISITRGFRFEERLTDEEKSTMQEPSDECIKPKKVMMTWKPSKARSIMKAPAKKAKSELRELLLTIQEISNRVVEIPKDCPPQRKRQLELKKERQIEFFNSRPLMKIDETPMYNQMKRNPETFQLFIMAENDKVPELEAMGMMQVDVEIDDRRSGNFCENCDQHNIMCMCINEGGKKKPLPDCNCINCLKEICIGDIGEIDDIFPNEGAVKVYRDKNRKRSEEEEESPVKKVILNVQGAVQSTADRVAGTPIKAGSPIKRKREKEPVITTEVAKSVPMPQVVQFDQDFLPEHIIRELKGKMDEVYETRNNVGSNSDVGSKPSAQLKVEVKTSKKKSGKKDNKSNGDGKASTESTSASNEKTESNETEDKKQLKMNIQVKVSQKVTIGDQQTDDSKENADKKEDSESGKVEKITVRKIGDENDSENKKKIEVEIQIPFKNFKLPNEDSVELNEEFVKENPDILKQVIEALKNADEETINLLTDDDKCQAGNNNKPKQDIDKIFLKSTDEPKADETEKPSYSCCHSTEPGSCNIVPVTQEEVEAIIARKRRESSLKESEKSFNIIKQISNQSSESGEQDNKSTEESKEKIIFEEYKENDQCSDKPKCNCAAIKEIMIKEKLLKEKERLEEEYRMEQLNAKKERRDRKLKAKNKLNIGTQTAVKGAELKPDSTANQSDAKAIVKAEAKQKEGTSNGKSNLGPQANGEISKGENDTNPSNGNGSPKKKNGKKKKGSKSVEEKPDVVNHENQNSGLRRCASCDVIEPAPKAFMKCQKCKLENVTMARYYCGRECQVKDWSEKHKREHKENLLN